MGFGDVDLWVNGWFPLHNTYRDDFEPGARVIGYVAKGGALQGYLIDKKTADEYGIKSLEDFKKRRNQTTVRQRQRRQGRSGRLPTGLGLRVGH